MTAFGGSRVNFLGSLVTGFRTAILGLRGFTLSGGGVGHPRRCVFVGHSTLVCASGRHPRLCVWVGWHSTRLHARVSWGHLRLCVCGCVRGGLHSTLFCGGPLSLCVCRGGAPHTLLRLFPWLYLIV